MRTLLSVRLLYKEADGRPYVPASVVARLTLWSEGTIRNRATSSTHPLPFRSIRLGGKRVFPVESLRDFLISLEQQQEATTEATPEPRPKPKPPEGQNHLRQRLANKFAAGRKSRQKKSGDGL
jgi:hypothetical protein